jgi:hypothetical protein
MRRLLVIGTPHLADPDLFQALEDALNQADPDQLILEMQDDAAAGGAPVSGSPEMLFAYRWAEKRGVPVRGHEPSGSSILRDSLASERINALDQELRELVRGLSPRRTIDIFLKRGAPETSTERRVDAVVDELIDPQKALDRTQAIIAAIRRVAAPEGTVLIICGGAHTPHIAAALAGCQIIHGEHFF